MHKSDKVIYEVKTKLEHYQVVDTVYDGRPARVLFSGHRTAAQSGIAFDESDELLFDYNQRFIEIVEQTRPKRVLIIGGGAFTLPKTIFERYADVNIDVVEIDPDLVTIAKIYFGLPTDPRIHIYHQNGRTYLEDNKIPYDLIIIDAFTHANIPAELATIEAATHVKNNLTENGLVAMNIIATYRGPRSQALRAQYASYASLFRYVQFYAAGRQLSDWESQNFILLAANAEKNIPNLYTQLMNPPLSISASDIYLDVE